MIETVNQYARKYTYPPKNERIASRGLVIENGKILLSYEKNTGVYMTPGGGLEDKESLEDCCVRELKEETGCIVKPIKRFLAINEYCDETLYISNYFICEKIAVSNLNLTDIEIEHGMMPVWTEIDKALEIFGDYESKSTDVASLYLREFTVLSKYLNSEN